MFWDIFEVECMCKDSNVQYTLYRNHLYWQKYTLKSKREAKIAIISSKFSLHIIGIVAYISTFSNPSHASRQSSSFRINEWFHSNVIETVWLEKIDDVEAILYVFTSVGYREKVPLCVAVGIVVSCQYQIILKLWSLSIILCTFGWLDANFHIKTLIKRLGYCPIYFLVCSMEVYRVLVLLDRYLWCKVRGLCYRKQLYWWNSQRKQLTLLNVSKILKEYCV